GLRIKLTGTKSNRDGIGATVRLTSGGETQTQMLRSGSSYLSASELVLTFGLAHNEKADTVEIRWPSGEVDRLSNARAGQTVTVPEGKRIRASRAFKKKKYTRARTPPGDKQTVPESAGGVLSSFKEVFLEQVPEELVVYLVVIL